MTTTQSIDLGDLLDQATISRFHIVVFVLAFVTLFVDGVDYASMLVAAPAMMGALQIDQSAMGLIFGAGNLGLLAGALLFSKLGDSMGRRPAIILGVLTYSLPALATGFVSGTHSLFILRLLTVIGIGGVLPNIVALLNEAAPRRIRASFVIAALIGYALGAAASGGLAAVLIPRFGWQSLFFVISTFGIVLALVLIIFLPESVRYLALTEPTSSKLLRTVSLLSGKAFGPQHTFVLGNTSAPRKASLSILFRGSLARATPLLWLSFFLEAITFYALISWTTVILQRQGVAPATTSLAFAYGALGGVAARVVMTRFLDRSGPIATVAASLVTVTVLACLALLDLNATMLVVGFVAAVSFSQGAHDSLYSIVGLFYPTTVRSTAIGTASSLSRLAAVVAPVLGGAFLDSSFPASAFYLVIAIPYLLLTICCIILTPYYWRAASISSDEAVAST